MEFQEYVKGKRTIRATETAYRALYKAQGFAPKEGAAEKPQPKSPPAEGVQPDEGASLPGAGGSSGGDNGEGAASGKPKRAK